MPLSTLGRFLLGFAAGIILAACKEFAQLPEAEATLIEPVTAKRLKDRGPYVLQSILPEAFDVYMSEAPGAEPRGIFVGRLLPGLVDSPATLEIAQVRSDVRYYFDLVADDGTEMRVSERRLPLEGADNFRDMGGLPAADGKRIRWGQFYRADKLTELTEDDLRYLGSLDLRSVVDLRSEQEVVSAPDVLPKGLKGKPVNYVHMPIYNEAEDTTDIKGRILSGTFGRKEADNLLVEVNRLLASREAYRFQPFVDLIQDPRQVPVVYHCTSGKDRTGFATYLLLHSLGVDSAMVFNDYLMSNYYRFDRNRRNLRKVNIAQYIKKVDPEVLKPLMLVDPTYLQAAVSEIEKSYGSVDSFLVKEYGLTGEKKKVLRERYLY